MKKYFFLVAPLLLLALTSFKNVAPSPTTLGQPYLRITTTTTGSNRHASLEADTEFYVYLMNANKGCACFISISGGTLLSSSCQDRVDENVLFVIRTDSYCDTDTVITIQDGCCSGTSCPPVTSNGVQLTGTWGNRGGKCI